VYCFWTTFEIPVLANADKLLKKFGSKRLLIAGMFCIIMKLFLFSLLELETSFYWQLLIIATLMHGLAFSLHYIALMDYLDRYAHKDMRTTYLATMNIAKTTLAGVAGGAIGAVVIANFGSAMLMRGSAVCTAFLAVFFILFVKSPKE
jgi:predicted MFS family arabinose efflux permease